MSADVQNIRQHASQISAWIRSKSSESTNTRFILATLNRLNLAKTLYFKLYIVYI